MKNNRQTKKYKDEIIKSPSDDELANRWIGTSSNTIHGLGGFRRYKEGIWDEISLTQVQREILDVLIKAKSEGIRPNNTRVNSVVEISRILTTISNDHFLQGSNIIVFRNGTLHLDVNTPGTQSMGLFLPHSKENYATASLLYDYDPTAEPVTWLRILSRLSPEVVALLQEYFGYCLTRETKHEIALWLTGLPGSGKSIIIAGLKAMAGSLAVQLSISDIERSKFALPLIVGKHIIYSTEQFTTTPTSIDNLNKIVSGETLLIEEKYEKPFNYTAYQKIIWASSGLPEIPAGDGFYRRFKVISVPHLRPDEVNLDIKSLVMQDGPGILNWALLGLERLKKRGYFEIPQSVISATDQFKNKNNVVREFVEACCETGGNYKTQATPIYKTYSNWCLANKYVPISITKLAAAWKALGYTNTHLNGSSYWIGIRLKSETDLSDEKKDKYMFN
jgi:putative DNA primase/helicase